MQSLHPAKQPKVFSPFPGIFWALCSIIFEIFQKYWNIFWIFPKYLFFCDIFWDLVCFCPPDRVIFWAFCPIFFEKFQKISKFFSNFVKIFDILWINLNFFWNILFFTCRISTHFSLRLKFTCRISTHFSLRLKRILDPSPKTSI